MMIFRVCAVCLLFFVLCLVAIGCGESDDAADSETTDDDDDDNDNDDDNDDDNDNTPLTGQIDLPTLRDKISGSWVGQMAGVTWAASTEFNFTGRIMPEDKVPEWKPSMVNAGFLQDDVYVEIPFIEVMRDQGIAVGWTALGDFFRDTKFPLWHANDIARDNLRAGIPAPDSGHYRYNEHADDIDWQIEADFVGTMCPGLINESIEIAWRAGHVVNYGDGVLGGVFLAAMHAAAFFATDLAEIIEAGRQALPAGSKYRRVVDDVIGWHEAGYVWEETWQLLQDKWGADDRCPSYDNFLMASFNIDAKINGAYVLIGLLYGEGDFEESMRIAMRCGQDSDCNPSSAAGILGNWRGFDAIPDKFKSALEPARKFLFTTYSLNDAVAINLDLARQTMSLAGAEVEGSGENEVWTVPLAAEVQPPLLEQWPAEANEPPVLTARIVSQDGATVELAATATDADGILAYEWYFGDLTRAAGPTVEHTYTAPGTYEITAYVADQIGNTAWQVLTVTVP